MTSVRTRDGKLRVPANTRELRDLFESIESIVASDTRFMAQAAIYNALRMENIERLLEAQISTFDKFATIAALLAERLQPGPNIETVLAGFQLTAELKNHTQKIEEMIGTKKRSRRREQRAVDSLGRVVEAWETYQRALDPDGWDKAKRSLGDGA